MNWLYLLIAIIFEIIATTALKQSNGFTNHMYTAISLFGYGFALFFLSMVLKTIPVGVAYAIWSGVGVAIITLIGLFFFNQKIDLAGMIGIGLIITGVIILNVFSKASIH
jgi:small multidrug resistance pump